MLCGCGGKPEIERLPVSGTVTVNGQPLSSGRIRFTPQVGTVGPAGAAGVANGKFSIPAEAGVVAGEYRVEIEAEENLGFDLDDEAAFAARGGKPLPPNGIPAEFNRESRLTATVRSDVENVLEFPVSFEPRKPRR
jgi:hypothetical protein